MRKFLPISFNLFGFVKPFVWLGFVLLFFLFLNPSRAQAVVSNVNFTPASFVANTSTTWTITLTPGAARPLRSSGDTITVVFPAGFDVSSLTTSSVTYGSGFAADASAASVVVTGQSVAIVGLTEGGVNNVLDAGVAGTFTLSGITNATAGTYAASGFTAKTNRENTAIASSSDVTLTPNTVVPTMSTSAASSITATSAVINGVVTSTGGANTTVTFEYGTASNLAGAATVTATQSPVADPGANVAVSYTLLGLTPETTYYYRVIGTFSAGTTNGSIRNFTASVTPRYWVGGTGNWSSNSHWSLTSGGSGGASVPQYTNDARFDANSFSTTGQTVTLDTTATSNSIDWTGSLYSPTFALNNQSFTVSGSLTFISGMTIDGSFNDFIFSSSGTNDIYFAGKTFTLINSNQEFEFTGGGIWNMRDDWSPMLSNALFIESGTFNTNNHSFTLRHLYDGSGHSVTSGTLTVNLGSSSIKIIDGINFTKSGSTLLSSSANMTFEPDIDWTIVSVKSGTQFASMRGMPGTNTGNVWVITNNALTTGSLTLEPAGSSTYQFYGMTIGEINSNGYAGNLVKVSGNLIASSQISTDYLSISSSTCSGVTPCYAGSHSFDGGGNSGWVFTAAPPVLTTSAATRITTTTATLNASANGEGDSTPVTFVYGTDPTLSSGTATVTATGSPVSGFSDTAVSYSLTGLLPGTTYYYKVSATNTGGTAAGSILSFTTLSDSSSSSSTISIPDPGQASYWRVNQPFNNTLTIAGSSGGTIGSLDNKANLVLGAGANSANTNTFFWLAPRTSADILAGNSVAGKVANIPQIVTTYPLSSIYELDPSSLVDGSHISNLSKPVTMTLNISKLSGNVAIQYYDPVTKKWSVLNTFLVVNPDKKDVSFVASKAGLYVAVEAPSINNNATQSVNQPTSASSKEKPASKEDVVSKPSPTPAITSQAPKFIVNSMANLGVGIINSINNGSSLVKNAGSKISGIFNFGNVFKPSKPDKVLAAKTVDLRNAFSFRFVFPKINISIGNPSDVLGASIIDLGYKLVRQPTEISDLHVEKLASDSAVISWKTNDPADSKVSFGFTPDYGQDVQSGDRVVDHKMIIKGLKPGTTYFYEVMSQGKTYVYDARHEFKTPSE